MLADAHGPPELQNREYIFNFNSQFEYVVFTPFRKVYKQREKYLLTFYSKHLRKRRCDSKIVNIEKTINLCERPLQGSKTLERSEKKKRFYIPLSAWHLELQQHHFILFCWMAQLYSIIYCPINYPIKCAIATCHDYSFHIYKLENNKRYTRSLDGHYYTMHGYRENQLSMIAKWNVYPLNTDFISWFLLTCCSIAYIVLFVDNLRSNLWWERFPLMQMFRIKRTVCFEILSLIKLKEVFEFYQTRLRYTTKSHSTLRWIIVGSKWSKIRVALEVGTVKSLFIQK